MTVLDRSELQASPLADLHLIADQIGLEGFRRLRKADLIDAILGTGGEGESAATTEEEDAGRPAGLRRPRLSRGRRGSAASKAREQEVQDDEPAPSPRRGRGRTERERPEREDGAERPVGRDERVSERADRAERPSGRTERPGRAERPADRAERPGRAERPADRAERPDRIAEGVVEILGNGSAFLRVSPPESSEDDVYISAAQVRRCELVSGDRVGGPVRTPRRSERYPSLVRVDTINGEPADSVVEGTRYEDLPVSYPSERLALDSEEPTLKAIESLTPLGLGSRAVIAGPARSGKTEMLRRILGALAAREGLETMVVLAGARPEEIAEWGGGPVAPSAALTFAVSPDAQGQAVESVVETAKRLATRGGNALVLIDGLDGLHPHTARKVLAAARNLTDSGSLTIIATASRPFGGESTVIALDSAVAGAGRFPALDLLTSGTLRPELLVGEDGAEAIARARAAAAQS